MTLVPGEVRSVERICLSNGYTPPHVYLLKNQYSKESGQLRHSSSNSVELSHDVMCHNVVNAMYGKKLLKVVLNKVVGENFLRR